MSETTYIDHAWELIRSDPRRCGAALDIAIKLYARARKITREEAAENIRDAILNGEEACPRPGDAT